MEGEGRRGVGSGAVVPGKDGPRSIPSERASASSGAGEAPLGSSKSSVSAGGPGADVQSGPCKDVAAQGHRGENGYRSLLRLPIADGIVWVRKGPRGLFVEISQPLRDRRSGVVRWINVCVYGPDLVALERGIAKVRDLEGGDDGVRFAPYEPEGEGVPPEGGA